MKSPAHSKSQSNRSVQARGATKAAAALLLAASCFWEVCAGVVTGPSLGGASKVDHGELLLGELNCAACHKADPALASRLDSRLAPVLGEAGMSVTPQFLREFLADPQQAKPGTTMPDVLGALPGGEKAAAVEALTHYLVSITPAQGGASSADALLLARGKRLYHTIGCVACHAPFSAPMGNSDMQIAVMPPQDLVDASVPLGPLAQKYTVDSLTRLLVDPVKFRPSGRMPSLNLSDMEARSISMYLLRQQISADGRSPEKVSGLRYSYFEGDLPDDPKPEELKMVESGSVEGFSIAAKKRRENFLFRFEGLLTIKTAGSHRFILNSDDGARLFIGEKKVADTWGDHPMQEAQGKIDLQPGEYPITVIYYNRGADGDLKVSWSVPGGKRAEIPANLLSHIGTAMKPVGDAPFAVDAVKAARGAELFSQLSCNACHTTGKGATSPAFKEMASLNAQAGCLADQPSGKAARYGLSQEQRKGLRSTLAKIGGLRQPQSAADQVNRKLLALNCYACHVRDDVGGPVDARREYFSVLGEADMGDEGRIPPHLSKVGGKLKREWLEEVLLKKGAVRPYNATRMPQFGKAAAGGLPELFEKADWAGRAEPVLDGDIVREEKIGRKLAGTSGLTCVACHTFGPHKSLGIPAIDLTTMGRRLRFEWFQRYMPDPAALRPGTRMPSFWPGGVSANTEILGGDKDKQLHALWAYLAKGAAADVPAGLVVGKMELVAEKEAVIYRNFIQGAGSRAIGVGYPEKVNLAFDANELRLAMIWQGSFIDASRHSTGRGEGYQPPLGDHVLHLAEGAAFAILADGNAAWPTEKGRNPAFRMRGYKLDDLRRPTFLYSFNEVLIEDTSKPKGSDLDLSLDRSVVLKSSQPPENLYFRAAVADKIEPKGEGAWKVDDGLVIKIRLGGDRKPFVRQSGGKQELLVPITFNSGSARFGEEFIW